MTTHPELFTLARRRTLLIVAHPGHELRVHGWLELARPPVLVLTDGSGHVGQSRLASTTALLERAGATPGAIYGRFTDAAIYQAVLQQDAQLFVALAEEIADAIVAQRAEVVVGDAAEGYNPTHDMCRLLINCATAMATRQLNATVECVAFPLADRPDQISGASGTPICLTLSDDMLARKLQAAAAYPELAGEVAAAMQTWGPDAFRKECFWRVAAGDGIEPIEQPPFYERYGEGQVAKGLYSFVLRYGTHVQPIAAALHQHVQRGKSLA